MATIFLDRDGVINENRADYVKSWSEFCFLPGAKEAIAMLTQAGHRLIVCTNQAGIARGRVSQETVEDIHHHMGAEITGAGGSIERVYYCPHGKDEGCFCRKPRPGMLLRARDELGVDMHNALFIGDSISDIQAALAAGVPPILVLTGLGMQHLREHYHEAPGSFHIAVSLKHTAETILQGFSDVGKYHSNSHWQRVSGHSLGQGSTSCGTLPAPRTVSVLSKAGLYLHDLHQHE